MVHCPVPPQDTWDEVNAPPPPPACIRPHMTFCPSSSSHWPLTCWPSAPARDIPVLAQTMRSRMLLLMSRSLSPQLFLPLLPPGRALLQLPDEAWDTLEVFVLSKRELAAAIESLDDGDSDGDGGGRVARRGGAPAEPGRRMAVLSTLVRLLEMRVEALEGEEGTGPLEADLQALAVSGRQLTWQRTVSESHFLIQNPAFINPKLDWK